MLHNCFVFKRILKIANPQRRLWNAFLICLLTAGGRVLIENPTGSQLVKKFPTFYGTRWFLTALTSTRHLSLPLARSIQSMPTHPTSWTSILILSSHLHLGLHSGLFPSGFSTKTLHKPLLSPMCATCPAHLILFGLHSLSVLFFLTFSLHTLQKDAHKNYTYTYSFFILYIEFQVAHVQVEQACSTW